MEVCPVHRGEGSSHRPWLHEGGEELPLIAGFLRKSVPNGFLLTMIILGMGVFIEETKGQHYKIKLN